MIQKNYRIIKRSKLLTRERKGGRERDFIFFFEIWGVCGNMVCFGLILEMGILYYMLGAKNESLGNVKLRKIWISVYKTLGLRSNWVGNKTKKNGKKFGGFGPSVDRHLAPNPSRFFPFWYVFFLVLIVIWFPPNFDFHFRLPWSPSSAN